MNSRTQAALEEGQAEIKCEVPAPPDCQAPKPDPRLCCGISQDAQPVLPPEEDSFPETQMEPASESQEHANKQHDQDTEQAQVEEQNLHQEAHRTQDEEQNTRQEADHTQGEEQKELQEASHRQNMDADRTQDKEQKETRPNLGAPMPESLLPSPNKELDLIYDRQNSAQTEAEDSDEALAENMAWWLTRPVPVIPPEDFDDRLPGSPSPMEIDCADAEPTVADPYHPPTPEASCTAKHAPEVAYQKPEEAAKSSESSAKQAPAPPTEPAPQIPESEDDSKYDAPENVEPPSQPPPRLSERAAKARLYRVVQPRMDGSYLAPEEVIKMYADKVGGGREKVLNLFEKSGYSSAWC